VSITLTPAEIEAITRYKPAALQVKELHRQGFYRARLGRTGGVILERAHYEAVCAGKIDAMNAPGFRPRVRTA
jgi:hypothetical protein